jgi:two-component system, NarL family, sensor histidine kinase UhpB
MDADLLRAREQERRRLACDLHDECGQHLTALRLCLDAVRTGAASPARGDHLDRAIALAAALDDSLEAVARGLRPPVLDAGPGAAIAGFARRWSTRARVPVDVVGADTWRHGLPDDAAVHLYRTVQEGLHNVARHAAATRVVIRLARTATEASLAIADDGVGFSVAAVAARRRDGGFGLVSLHERAEALHGRLEIVSAPGCGTTLSLWVPLLPAASARVRSSRPVRRASPAVPA